MRSRSLMASVIACVGFVLVTALPVSAQDRADAPRDAASAALRTPEP